MILPGGRFTSYLIKAALATDMIEKDPAPFVFQDKLDDFYVAIRLMHIRGSPTSSILPTPFSIRISRILLMKQVLKSCLHTIAISGMGIKPRYRRIIYRRIMLLLLLG